mmetsp:Transcript_120612/g.237120  ORF Transcript_120612/g.237120 Transcript_120612/m.237120 type:complete len:276 (-) Transcript_120612:202-1029(-)
MHNQPLVTLIRHVNAASAKSALNCLRRRVPRRIARHLLRVAGPVAEMQKESLSPPRGSPQGRGREGERKRGPDSGRGRPVAVAAEGVVEAIARLAIDVLVPPSAVVAVALVPPGAAVAVARVPPGAAVAPLPRRGRGGLRRGGHRGVCRFRGGGRGLCGCRRPGRGCSHKDLGLHGHGQHLDAAVASKDHLGSVTDGVAEGRRVEPRREVVRRQAADGEREGAQQTIGADGDRGVRATQIHDRQFRNITCRCQLLGVRGHELRELVVFQRGGLQA